MQNDFIKRKYIFVNSKRKFLIKGLFKANYSIYFFKQIIINKKIFRFSLFIMEIKILTCINFIFLSVAIYFSCSCISSLLSFPDTSESSELVISHICSFG